jgi:uncharacterized protein (DUF1501 family)
MPDSLRGATQAIELQSVSDFRLIGGPQGFRRSYVSRLSEMYGTGKDEVLEAGRQTLRVLEALERLDPETYQTEGGAAYPASDIGQALKQVAILIKSDLGLEVAALDKGGWDTHFGQGSSEGLLSNLLADLSRSLAAFAADMGPRLSRVTLVAMTEFGRRSYENSTLGTDHGRGSVMLLLGGGADGGRVRGAWPGLGPNDLEEPGDLRVTTDYRSVLSEVLAKRMGFTRTSDVFPGLA